jgi:hypothetical protein
MQRLIALLRRTGPFGQALALTSIIAASTSAIAAVPSASAEKSYSCGSCENVSGPNEPGVNEASATIYEGDVGICATLWENVGEGKYVREGFECNASGTHTDTGAIACTGSSDHGDAKAYYKNNYHLSGLQYFKTVIC